MIGLGVLRCEVHIDAGDFQELVTNLVLQPRRGNQTEDKFWEVGWGYLSDRSFQNWTWENINTQVREVRNEENRDVGENLEEKLWSQRWGITEEIILSKTWNCTEILWDQIGKKSTEWTLGWTNFHRGAWIEHWGMWRTVYTIRIQRRELSAFIFQYNPI